MHRAESSRYHRKYLESSPAVASGFCPHSSFRSPMITIVTWGSAAAKLQYERPAARATCELRASKQAKVASGRCHGEAFMAQLQPRKTYNRTAPPRRAVRYCSCPVPNELRRHANSLTTARQLYSGSHVKYLVTGQLESELVTLTSEQFMKRTGWVTFLFFLGIGAL